MVLVVVNIAACVLLQETIRARYPGILLRKNRFGRTQFSIPNTEFSLAVFAMPF